MLHLCGSSGSIGMLHLLIKEGKPHRVILGQVELCKGLAVNSWPHTKGSVQVLGRYRHNGAF